MRTTTLLASLLSFYGYGYGYGLAHAQNVWVAPESQKVRPGDPPGSATSALLEAAQNEFEAFHVVISGAATGVTVTAGDLQGPGSATIGGGDVRIFREGFLDLATPSNIAGATGRWPDVMIPAVDEVFGQARNAFPVSVPAGEQQPVYVEYHVPPAAPAGVYNGTVHVAGGGLSVDVPVMLVVHAVKLPSTSSLRSAFGMGWADACTAHFGGYTQCGGDPGTVKMIQLYTRFALDHRITITDSTYTGPAAKGAGYDWATWDQLYRPMLDGTAATRLAGAQLTSVRYAWTKDSAHYGEWAQHAKQRGWFDRTFDYTCDEPPMGCSWSDINARAATVLAGDPDFHTLVTTTLTNATTNGVLAQLDTLVPLVNEMQPMGAASQRASYDGWLAGGKHRQLWWYQSCMSDGCFIVGGNETVGWPSYMIDAPATLNRAMEWQSYRQHMQGELYYDTTYAFTQGDAWQSQFYFGGNGDGTLFYPGTPAKIGGTDDIPLASLRMKMIRAGMEDYEYLKMLADAGDPAMADDEAAKLAPTSTSFTTDPTVIDAARHRILLRIEALQGIAPPPGMPPNLGGTPSDGSGNGNANGSVNDPGGSLSAQPGTLGSKVAGCSAAGRLAPGPLSLIASLALGLYLAVRRLRRS